MSIDASLVSAIGGLIFTVVSVAISFGVSRTSAKKDEVQGLREQVVLCLEQNAKLLVDNQDLRNKYNSLDRKYLREHEYTLRLIAYIKTLYEMLEKAGLKPPPMPEPIDDAEELDPKQKVAEATR